MSTFYDVLREVIGSWSLVFFFCFFLGAALLALRPSARKGQEEASLIPFKED